MNKKVIEDSSGGAALAFIVRRLEYRRIFLSLKILLVKIAKSKL